MYWHCILSFLIIATSCQAGNTNESMKDKHTDRFPAVSGSFYPAQKVELYKQLKTFFEMIRKKSKILKLSLFLTQGIYILEKLPQTDFPKLTLRFIMRMFLS